MNLSDIKLSVCIPVGPKSHHKKWLQETINSVLYQTEIPDEIILVDDQAHIDLEDYFPIYNDINSTLPYDGDFNFYLYAYVYLSNYMGIDCGNKSIRVSKVNTPWLAGVVHAFNSGIALAKNEWVLQLGSDDKLDVNAIRKAKETILETGDPIGLYNFSCQIMETGEIVTWFNHANVVSKSLYRETGGLHPMTVTGGMDAALISIMMVHFPHNLHKIEEGVPLYFVREHDQRYTLESASRYGDFMVRLRNDLTTEWKKPEWTK